MQGAPPVPDASPPATPDTSPTPVPEATPAPTPSGPPPVSIEINLQEQKAHLLKNGKTVETSPISSGRYGHLTPTGDFQVQQKDPNHKSTLYGKIVDGSGRTVISGADSAMAVPRGCHFSAAPMKNFIRFEGATGMHAGVLPGYPASHGCVRMPATKAKIFYDAVQLGAPVHVFGKTPTRKPESRVVSHSERRVSKPEPTPEAPAPPPEKRGLFDRMFGRNKS